MINTSSILILALVFAFIAMIAVIILLLRTTRKVVDKNTALAEKMMEIEKEAANPLSPVEKIRQDLSNVDNPAKMNDAELMAWIDKKMDETNLYQQSGLDLKSASEALGVSQRRIQRVFKDKYGSFSSYLTEKRLSKACSLLKDHPEYTIEAICLDAGFRTRRTFQTIFKSHIGMSPSEYRNATKLNSQ